jgi:predicted short-subunit dehydrogenase-like oxidoreductase (DUF2520 family)
MTTNPPNKRITLVGAGNVATVLGKRLQAAGHTILQVCSPRNAAPLAAVVNAEAIQRPEDLKPADLYILAVSDTALRELAGVLRLGDAVVVHTAGALPLAVLQNVSTRYGVLYPLQSLRKETEPATIPFLVDGSDPGTSATIEALARELSPVVRRCTDEERLFFHIAGVFVNNFPNYLFTQTDLFLRDKGLHLDLLLPLMAETVRRLADYPPADVQTGPAVRGDDATIELHLQQLAPYPEPAFWYRTFTHKITSFYAR